MRCSTLGGIQLLGQFRGLKIDLKGLAIQQLIPESCCYLELIKQRYFCLTVAPIFTNLDRCSSVHSTQKCTICWRLGKWILKISILGSLRHMVFYQIKRFCSSLMGSSGSTSSKFQGICGAARRSHHLWDSIESLARWSYMFKLEFRWYIVVHWFLRFCPPSLHKHGVSVLFASSASGKLLIHLSWHGIWLPIFCIEKGPIFSARFSKNDAWLLTGSLDGTTCLWDVKEKRLHRQYRCHKGGCLFQFFT